MGKRKMSSLVLDSSVIVRRGSLKRPHAGKSRRRFQTLLLLINKFSFWSGGQTPACWPTLGLRAWGADSHKITTPGPVQPRPMAAVEVVLHGVHYPPEWLWTQGFVLLPALCSAYQRAAQMKELAAQESDLHPPAEQRKMPHHVTDANHVWLFWFTTFYKEIIYRV